MHGDLKIFRGWIRGPRNPKSIDVANHSSLFDSLRGGSRQTRDGDLNLSESDRLAVFDDVRSYILIIYQKSHIIL